MTNKLFLTIACLGVVLTLSACIENIYKAAEWTMDIGESEAWKTQALQGDAEAQYKVGQLYCCGERPRYDNIKALYWFCMAAKQGQRDAMFEVGNMYENEHRYKGSVIPRDPVLAYTYYMLAVAQGNDGAVSPYNMLKETLTNEEQDRATAIFKQWPNIPCEVTR
ncbi:MAG: sel1 repeat family protein [Rickettsiales bacterium]|nr:sel1 repeat family protein [Rickettsiales bacterium]